MATVLRQALLSVTCRAGLIAAGVKELSLTLALPTGVFLEKQYVQTLAKCNLISLQRMLKYALSFRKNRGRATQKLHASRSSDQVPSSNSFFRQS